MWILFLLSKSQIAQLACFLFLPIKVSTKSKRNQTATRKPTIANTWNAVTGHTADPKPKKLPPTIKHSPERNKVNTSPEGSGHRAGERKYNHPLINCAGTRVRRGSTGPKFFHMKFSNSSSAKDFEVDAVSFWAGKGLQSWWHVTPPRPNLPPALS